MWRHPLISIAMLTFVIGVIWDAAQEILLTRTQFLTYTHVVDFGSIDVGKNSQFLLLMASVLITIITIPASVLLYRDDSGKSPADKIVLRVPLAARRPKLASFLIMAIVPEYCDDQFQLRVLAGTCNRRGVRRRLPWPYPQAKTWDPARILRIARRPGTVPRRRGQHVADRATCRPPHGHRRGVRPLQAPGSPGVAGSPHAGRQRTCERVLPAGVSQREAQPPVIQFGGPLSDHHRRGVRVAAHDVRHDRRIGHAQPRYAPDAECWVDDGAFVRTHPAGSDGVVHTRSIAPDELPEFGAGPIGTGQHLATDDPGDFRCVKVCLTNSMPATRVSTSRGSAR